MTKSFVLMLAMLFASQVAAQTAKTTPSQKSKPNLGGTWILDFAEDSKGKTVRPADRTVLVVKQQEPEIRVVENAGSRGESELKYYTDGRGEVNSTVDGVTSPNKYNDPAQKIEPVKSKTTWEGKKLVTRTQRPFVADGKMFVEDIVKESRLSKDGKTLTIATRITVLPPYSLLSVAVAPTRGAGTVGREVTPRMNTANPNLNSQMHLNGPVWRSSGSTSTTKSVYRRDSK